MEGLSRSGSSRGREQILVTEEAGHGLPLLTFGTDFSFLILRFSL
jgi:hypothetical protein